jgi:predicted nucleotide-binding protein
LKKAFIVHGHDIATQQKTARFLEKIGFETIILSEKPSKGMTIIEKLEYYIDVEGFGVVLYTPDDEGSVKDKKDYKPRARQNVVFEHGWLIGALGVKKLFKLLLIIVLNYLMILAVLFILVIKDGK